MTEDEIKEELKAWVLNKDLGETNLQRAARLGYTVSIFVRHLFDLNLFISNHHICHTFYCRDYELAFK